MSEQNQPNQYEDAKHKEYIPPVGPGSKSVPPSPSWREMPSGLLSIIDQPSED